MINGYCDERFTEARKIFEGELLIDPDHTWFDEGQKFEKI